MGAWLDRLFGRRRQRRGLSLDEYALYLARTHWTMPVEPRLTRAAVPQFRPQLKRVKAVVWDVYGTLLYCRHDGESERFLVENPEVLAAFGRTVEYFKMWPAMSKSGLSPGEYVWGAFRELVQHFLVEKTHRSRDAPEVKLDQVWERILARLAKGGFTFDEGVLGPAPAFAQKVAFFLDESHERTVLYPGALAALEALKERGLRQGLAGDGQVYTNAQVVKALVEGGGPRALGAFFDPLLSCYSYEIGRRRPSPVLYRTIAQRATAAGLLPNEILVIGNHLLHDVVLAASIGFRAALFAGAAETVHVPRPEPGTTPPRPDAVITDLAQVTEIIASA